MCRVIRTFFVPRRYEPTQAACLEGKSIIASFYRTKGKRWFDIVMASLLLFILATPMVVIAIVVRAMLGRPTLFRQQRPGHEGRPFTILKFRTMLEAIDATGNTLPDEQRLTPLGRVLRTTSLDELPELWNVVLGDMSLVGPRPLMMEYLPRYSAEQRRRHDVLPGITGLAQVRGRNALSWDEKFAYDLEYVDSVSLRGDIGILAATLSSVIRREGISASGHATMPEFLGSLGPIEVEEG